MDTKIDLVDFLDPVYVDMELWLCFQKRCHLDEVNASEILAKVIEQTLLNPDRQALRL